MYTFGSWSRKLCRLDNRLRLVVLLLWLLRCSLALLLELLGLPQLLPRDNALVLGLDLVSILGNLVALFRLGPEAGDGEAVVEVRSEIIHDANREHDICAELMRRVVVNICSGEAGGEAIQTRALNQAIEAFRRIFGNCKIGAEGAYLEHFEIETTHFEYLIFQCLHL